jgi:hypothetical protein
MDNFDRFEASLEEYETRLAFLLRPDVETEEVLLSVFHDPDVENRIRLDLQGRDGENIQIAIWKEHLLELLDDPQDVDQAFGPEDPQAS